MHKTVTITVPVEMEVTVYHVTERGMDGPDLHWIAEKLTQAPFGLSSGDCSIRRVKATPDHIAAVEDALGRALEVSDAR